MTFSSFGDPDRAATTIDKLNQKMSLYALLTLEWTASLWIGVVASTVLGGAAFLVAYLWYTAPARAVERLSASKACATALKCAKQRTPIKTIRRDSPATPAGAVLPAAAMRHFLPVGERLTTKRAVEVSKSNPLIVRLSEKSFMVVRFNLVFEWPRAAANGPGNSAFSRLETDAGVRLVSARELLFAVAYQVGGRAGLGSGSGSNGQTEGEGGEWQAKMQGRRRAVFDEEGRLRLDEYLEGEQPDESWGMPKDMGMPKINLQDVQKDRTPRRRQIVQ